MDKSLEKHTVTSSISEDVFHKLRESIVVGEIPSGSKLSEPALAKEYGISRGPLREALSRLEACSLVERLPNVGASVVDLSQQKLIEIYQIREVLEGLAARQAAYSITQPEINGLRDLLEQHKIGIHKDQGHAYFQKEGDFDFHFRIIQASKNTHLISLLCNELYYLHRLYRYQFGMPSSSRSNNALKEHKNIVDAMEAQDAELAEILMRRHIKASRLNVLKQLGTDSNNIIPYAK
ncbi:MAG: GntR family transcriptional regulator [Methylococcales bacterium]